MRLPPLVAWMSCPTVRLANWQGLLIVRSWPDGARHDDAGRAGRVTAGTNLVDRQGSSSQRRREVIRIGLRHSGAGGGDRNRTVGSTKDGGDRVAAGWQGKWLGLCLSLVIGDSRLVVLIPRLSVTVKITVRCTSGLPTLLLQCGSDVGAERASRTGRSRRDTEGA